MKRYIAMTQLFFTQDKWMDQSTEAAMGKAIGMHPDQCQQCLANEEIQDDVLLQRIKGEKAFKLEATPTFVIGKEIFEGVPTLDDIEKLIAKAQIP